MTAESFTNHTSRCKSKAKAMLIVNCIILLLLSCIHGKQAVPELVWLEDLNNDHHLRHLEMGLPNHLEFNLKRESGNELKLRLNENVRLNANAPVYEAVTENGKQKAKRLEAPLLDAKFYHDKETGTAVKIQCKKQPYGACKRVLEGSLSFDGNNYEIKPSTTLLTSRGMDSQTDVPHLIMKVEPPPEHFVRGLFGADYNSTTNADMNETAQHDHKAIPDSIPVTEVPGLPKPNIQPIPEEPPEPIAQQDLTDELRVFLKEEDEFIDKKRQKRAVGDLLAVEVVIVIDPALWKKYYAITEGNSEMTKDTATEYHIRERLTNIINGVSLRFEAIEDTDVNVYVTISEFLFYKTDNLFSQSIGIQTVKEVEYANSDMYLDGLPAWVSQAPITNHNDHTMVITGYDLYYGSYTKNNGVAGIAYTSGACTTFGTSILEDGDYFRLTSVAAHELGHNLSADHDGEGYSKDCSLINKYIMAPFVASFSYGERYSLNPWRFSDCSIQAFKRFFGSGRCFLDHGDYYNKDEWDEHNRLQPGERYSPDEQCKLIRGENSYRCSSYTDDVCRYLSCYDSQDGYCYYYAAARGTTCGQSMWCIDGQCVEKVISTTTEAIRTTTTQASTTTTPSTTDSSECVDIGWKDWSCQKVSDYFFETYSYRPSYWCRDPYWAKACCEFCTGSRTTSTIATTMASPCVDKRISKYFWRQEKYRLKEWCTDPEWKDNCCEFCTARGH